MKPYIVAAAFGDVSAPGSYLAIGTVSAERSDIASALAVDQIRRELSPKYPLAAVTTMELTEDLLRAMLALYDEPMPPGDVAKIVSIVPSRPPVPLGTF